MKIKMSGRLVRFAVLAWATAIAAPNAFAQLQIEIRRGVERPVPMAIVPFGVEDGGAPPPFDVSGLITTDLRQSGRFAPLAPKDMVSRPTQPSEVNLQDWRLLDVDVLVIGRMQPVASDRYMIVFQVFDVLRGQQLLGYRLESAADDLRSASHRIADMIFETLTGIPGVFSTRVAYISERRDAGASRYRLVVSDADGANPQVVADSPQPLMSPAWSPDGRRLAYVSFESNQSAIYIQTLRTGTRERVSARAGVNGAPVFSPDGRRLALTLSRDNGNVDVYILDLANQVLTRLTDSPAIDTEPAWGPNGQAIYFTSDRAGGPQIYRIQPRAGARAERVTYEGSYNARPRVSPDGKSLAVVHVDRGNYRIALVDLDTSVTQVLTDGELDESPCFAPNGALIIYATREGDRAVLASVSTDGRIRQEIASVEGDVREPVWSPFPRL
jgi:TolB protein